MSDHQRTYTCSNGCFKGLRDYMRHADDRGRCVGCGTGFVNEDAQWVGVAAWRIIHPDGFPHISDPSNPFTDGMFSGRDSWRVEVTFKSGKTDEMLIKGKSKFRECSMGGSRKVHVGYIPVTTKAGNYLASTRWGGKLIMCSLPQDLKIEGGENE